MILESDGIYAILNKGKSFKEWRFLTAGTECDPNLVIPQRAITKPEFDPKRQRLEEIISPEETEVIQRWEIIDLSPEEIEARKRPDGKNFQIEMISNPELLIIYQKILANSVAIIWLNEARAALSVYTTRGFATAVNALAQSIPLTKEEIAALNTALYKYDLELITWEGV